MSCLKSFSYGKYLTFCKAINIIQFLESCSSVTKNSCILKEKIEIFYTRGFLRLCHFIKNCGSRMFFKLSYESIANISTISSISITFQKHRTIAWLSLQDRPSLRLDLCVIKLCRTRALLGNLKVTLNDFPVQSIKVWCSVPVVWT